ncbi:MAG TPA: DUF4260 domain-containing protein [Thermomicrobiales bacterium]|jgi:hypothetical protein|nr:DUF4260 domain-containing protein [Thermomicrobiales bacterium]
MILTRPDHLLRLEAGAIAIGALAVFLALDGTWWWVPVLFLVPDLSAAGYLAGPRVGAASYNAAHTLVGPVLLVLAGLWMGSDLVMHLALIWVFHIGVDRVAGYGLKLPDAFTSTHMGRVGPRRAAPRQG